MSAVQNDDSRIEAGHNDQRSMLGGTQPLKVPHGAGSNLMPAPTAASIGKKSNLSAMHKNMDKTDKIDFHTMSIQSPTFFPCLNCFTKRSLIRYEHHHNLRLEMFQAEDSFVPPKGIIQRRDYNLATFDPETGDKSKHMHVERPLIVLGCGNTHVKITDADGTHQGTLVAPNCCSQLLQKITCNCSRVGELEAPNGTVTHKFKQACCQARVDVMDATTNAEVANFAWKGCFEQLENICCHCHTYYGGSYKVDTTNLPQSAERRDTKEKVLMAAAYFKANGFAKASISLPFV